MSLIKRKFFIWVFRIVKLFTESGRPRPHKINLLDLFGYHKIFIPLFLFLLCCSPVFSKETSSSIRSINFSGYHWTVKSRRTPSGPGPNYFSSNEKNVFIDKQGKLHLKITKDGDKYYCAQVNIIKSLGYGRYIFHLDSDVTSIDDNAVLGLFTYSNSKDYHHREIDIEFSKWGKPGNPNSQFAIQPSEKPGNKTRFDTGKKYDSLIVQFHWKENMINFTCYGVINNHKEMIKQWNYRGKDIPKKGDETCRMNLWLFRGKKPVKESEVIIRKFEFYRDNTPARFDKKED